MTGTVVVTGGAGYVGAHVCLVLAEHGYRPVVVDDLSTGHREAAAFGAFERLDVAADGLPAVLARHAPVAVVHAAALSDVAESFARPDLYRRVNVAGTARVASACRSTGVRRLVLLSSAAVYGPAGASPIAEDAKLRPISPYGESKLAAERCLAELCPADSGLAWAALRLFNVAGAAAGAGIGEDHAVERHLVPLAIRAALGTGAALRVFGAGHGTADGTAVRDYVHALDVAEAVRAAIAYLGDGGAPRAFNIGSGTGTSVLQVVAAVERACGLPVRRTLEAARPGDPPVLVAGIGLARRALGFRPQRSGIDRVVGDALAWERRAEGRPRAPAARSAG